MKDTKKKIIYLVVTTFIFLCSIGWSLGGWDTIKQLLSRDNTWTGINAFTRLTASKPIFSDANKNLVSTGTLAIDQGGTGQTTAALAFGALKQDATESATGAIELATDTETVTGSATNRATTPANITAKMAAPGEIGGTTAAAGHFTSLSTTTTFNPGAGETLTGTFSGFTTTETKTLNLTGVDGNRPDVRAIRLWISNDPTADTNINFILTFYNSDSMTEDERIGNSIFLNLTYTETNGGITATNTTDVVDSGAGLVDGDKVRFMGGTAETVTLTAIPTATGLTFTAATQAHADNTGIVRVHEIDRLLQLYDADSTNEIHAKMESLSAPAGSLNVYMEVEVQ